MLKKKLIYTFYNSNHFRSSNFFIFLKKYYACSNIKYNFFTKEKVIIVLGGDGEILKSLHILKNYSNSIYGINMGKIGFLLNKYSKNKFKSNNYPIMPFRVIIITFCNNIIHCHSFNEISIIRESSQISKISIIINNNINVNSIYCDGILITTPLGSTSYNSSIGGLSVPLNGNVFLLKILNSFNYKHCKDLLMLQNSNIKIKIINYKKRPNNIFVDFCKINNIKSIEIFLDQNLSKSIIFNCYDSYIKNFYFNQFYFL